MLQVPIMPTKQNKTLMLKNNSSFRSCISKISNTFIDYVDYLDILMPMYNLLECSDNYYMTSGSLWNYYSGIVCGIIIMMTRMKKMMPVIIE